MGKHILYFKGPAYPQHEQTILAEDSALEDHVRALRDAGHKVTIIGDSANGFNLVAVKSAVAANPDATIIFIDAHGAITGTNHSLCIRTRCDLETQQDEDDADQDGNIWVAELYEALADGAGKRPLNIFMNSCGSGNGCIEAAENLPHGSTLFNYVGQDQLLSYGIERSALKVTEDVGSNFAEQLFLSTLCNGMYDTSSPQITVSDASDPETCVWNLWDSAMFEAVDGPDGTFTPKAKRKIRRALGHLVDPQRLTQAIATIELFSKSIYHSVIIKNPATPVEAFMRFDHKNFRANVGLYDLLGPVCAIGYVMARHKIGAFQTWPKKRYTTKPEPVRRSDSRMWSLAIEGIWPVVD